MPPVALMDTFAKGVYQQVRSFSSSKNSRPRENGRVAPRLFPALRSCNSSLWVELYPRQPQNASPKAYALTQSRPFNSNAPIDSQTPGRPTGLFSIELKKQKKIFSLYPVVQSGP